MNIRIARSCASASYKCATSVYTYRRNLRRLQQFLLLKGALKAPAKVSLPREKKAAPSVVIYRTLKRKQVRQRDSALLYNNELAALMRVERREKKIELLIKGRRNWTVETSSTLLTAFYTAAARNITRPFLLLLIAKVCIRARRRRRRSSSAATRGERITHRGKISGVIPKLFACPGTY